MAVQDGEVIYFYTNAATSSNPEASLGGAISTASIPSAVANNLFDTITAPEAASGSVKYRVIAAKNTNGIDTSLSTLLYQVSRISGDVSFEIALGKTGGTAELLANEDTTPTTVTAFSQVEGTDNGFNQIDLTPTNHIFLFIKRIVPAGASDFGNQTAAFNIFFSNVTKSDGIIGDYRNRVGQYRNPINTELSLRSDTIYLIIVYGQSRGTGFTSLGASPITTIANLSDRCLMPNAGTNEGLASSLITGQGTAFIEAIESNTPAFGFDESESGALVKMNMLYEYTCRDQSNIPTLFATTNGCLDGAGIDTLLLDVNFDNLKLNITNAVSFATALGKRLEVLAIDYMGNETDGGTSTDATDWIPQCVSMNDQLRTFIDANVPDQTIAYPFILDQEQSFATFSANTENNIAVAKLSAAAQRPGEIKVSFNTNAIEYSTDLIHPTPFGYDESGYYRGMTTLFPNMQPLNITRAIYFKRGVIVYFGDTGEQGRGDLATDTKTLTVATITETGGTGTLTTNEPHDFVLSDLPTVTGADQSDYNLIKFTILSIPTTTSITYAVAGSPANATGTLFISHGGRMPNNPDLGLRMRIDTVLQARDTIVTKITGYRTAMMLTTFDISGTDILIETADFTDPNSDGPGYNANRGPELRDSEAISPTRFSSALQGFTKRPLFNYLLTNQITAEDGTTVFGLGEIQMSATMAPMTGNFSMIEPGTNTLQITANMAPMTGSFTIDESSVFDHEWIFTSGAATTIPDQIGSFDATSVGSNTENNTILTGGSTGDYVRFNGTGGEVIKTTAIVFKVGTPVTNAWMLGNLEDTSKGTSMLFTSAAPAGYHAVYFAGGAFTQDTQVSGQPGSGTWVLGFLIRDTADPGVYRSYFPGYNSSLSTPAASAVFDNSTTDWTVGDGIAFATAVAMSVEVAHVAQAIAELDQSTLDTEYDRIAAEVSTNHSITLATRV